MTIRDAKIEDLSAIVAIYNSTIESRIVTADTEPVSVESRIDWFYQYDCDRRPLWVLEQSGAIAGWLGVRSFYGRPAYQETVELSLYVSPEYRRQGVGKQLLQHAIDRSLQLGIKTLLGFIFTENIPSISLFQHFGFETWGTLPHVARFDSETRSLVILGKSLTKS